MWVSCFWGLMSHIIQLYVIFLSWETFYLRMKKHVSVPLIYRIPWIRHPISFAIALVHFVFSSPFIRWLYSWGFLTSGNMTAFIWPRWIVTSPVVLLMCAQSYPVLCILYVGIDVWGGLCSWTVATWLDIGLWPLISLDMVLYLCTSEMLHVLPSYGYIADDLASVSSGMT